MSFEETYKNSYSHGLESIYALESIDLRSIRKLESVQKEVEEPRVIWKRSVASQFEFDFGPRFRNWIEPFFLDEPIQVLRLSRFAERLLLEQKRERLRDLLLDLQFIKGQSHLLEITDKLTEYTAGKELERAQGIDFGSWIRTLCPSKRFSLILESYGLESILVGENRELNSHEWRLEALQQLRLKREEVKKRLDELMAVFVRPWMVKRKGLATRDEVIERLEKKAYEPQLVEPAIQFFEEVFELNLGLEEVEKGLYVDDGEAFREVVACARSYFRPAIKSYLLSHLISLVEREMARAWQGYEEGFVEKVLCLSSQFSLRKGEFSLANPGNNLYREKYVEADQAHCRYRGSWADRL
jgi:hypothetical protein